MLGTKSIEKVNNVLNLEAIPDEEFFVSVRPRAPYSAAQNTINERDMCHSAVDL